MRAGGGLASASDLGVRHKAKEKANTAAHAMDFESRSSVIEARFIKIPYEYCPRSRVVETNSMDHRPYIKER